MFLILASLLIASSVRANIGNIDSAINAYDSNSQTRMTQIIIDTNMPSKLFIGEQYYLNVKTVGNYVDEKGNIYKRKILSPIIIVDAPNFLVNKYEKNEDGTIFILTAPSTEGESKVRITASYGDKTSENVYGLKILSKPTWIEKQYLALYSGSLGIFGVEANFASDFIGALSIRGMTCFFNGSLYFRKKAADLDAYIMATELGARIFTEKILDRMFLFGGVNIGYDTEGRKYEGPTVGESRIYLGPNVGLKYLLGHYSIISQVEYVAYSNSNNVLLFKIGLGI
jgi:hypothetical protein